MVRPRKVRKLENARVKAMKRQLNRELPELRRRLEALEKAKKVPRSLLNRRIDI